MYLYTKCYNLIMNIKATFIIFLISFMTITVNSQNLLPPSLNPKTDLTSEGANIVIGWNYIKNSSEKCTIKNIINEIQADAGSATIIDKIWILENKIWNEFNTSQESILPKNKIMAIYSTSNFYYDLSQENCKKIEESRTNQIENIRNNQNVGIVENIVKTFGNILGIEKNENLSEDSFNTNQNINLRGNLNVIGESTLYNTTITGTLKAGQINIDSLNNSIDILGSTCGENQEICDLQTLYLQKSLSGNINVFNGKIMLNNEGEIVAKSIQVETLKTNQIIVNSQAQTTGKSVINANSTEVFVNTNSILQDSLVLITPTVSGLKEPIAVVEKVSGEGFKVKITYEYNFDIYFDWVIVKII